jgi:hypothetical protein
MMGILKWFFGDQSGAAIPGLFSVGSWFASKYFVIPFDAGIFNASAVLGMLAGYALGNVCFGGVDNPNRLLIAISAVMAFIIGLALMISYHFFITGNNVTDYWQVLWAVTQLGLVFACAGYLMPIAGIEFGKSLSENIMRGCIAFAA